MAMRLNFAIVLRPLFDRCIRSGDDCNRLLEEPESREADELVWCRRIA